jgi:hypothetical protein
MQSLLEPSGGSTEQSRVSPQAGKPISVAQSEQDIMRSAGQSADRMLSFDQDGASYRTSMSTTSIWPVKGNGGS